MAIEIYQLVIEGNLNNEIRQNVLHFQGTGTNNADTQAGGESLVAGWIANIEALYLACLPGSYSIDLEWARRVSPKTSTQVFDQAQYLQKPGTRGTDATTQQVAPCIFLVPPTGTKSGGKIFMPACPQGDLIGQAFAAAYVTATNALVAALQAGFTQAGITWIGFIYSRKLGSGVPIASHHLSQVVGIQKGRRKAVAD